ncbi:MAG: Rieske (2Fe-2S) protein [Bacteroidota bacterium]|nr:Rieske (2Fe-2S) protein [Bacteroidota bacterium]
MDRKEFIKTCGCACLGVSSMAILLQGCVTTKSITAPIVRDHLVIQRTDFMKGEKAVEYLIVDNGQLQFPIYIFRFSETEYTALYLRCTHQGNELNAYGDKLVCSAHGSEFDNKGNVIQGPAKETLRSFPVQITDQNILISLKKA